MGAIEWGNQFSNVVRELNDTKGREGTERIAYAQKTWGRGIDTQPLLRWRNESGILKVDFILRTPKASPGPPDRAEGMQVFARRCEHIESEPVFVWASPGNCYWVSTLSAKVSRVQAFLLGVAPTCGCDPWLKPVLSREIYESMRIWLKWFDKRK